MSEYKRIKPEIGKWYVSDNGPIQRKDNDPIESDTLLARSKCILSGPHDTKAEAEASIVKIVENDRNLKGRCYVWQASKADM
jgi:hypothetical protein